MTQGYNLEDPNQGQVESKIDDSDIRRICRELANRQSLTIETPNGNSKEFSQKLRMAVTENLKAYQQDGQPSLNINIINPDNEDFLLQLDRLDGNRRIFSGSGYKDYLNQFPEINLWVDISHIEERVRGLESKRDARLSAFQDAVILGQSIFVFEGEYNFGDLKPYIQERMSNTSTIKMK
jgi:hypothetical protein